MGRYPAWPLLAAVGAASLAGMPSARADGENLVVNPGLERVDGPGRPAGFRLAGDVAHRYAGDPRTEVASLCVALDSGADRDGDGERSGSVSQSVRGIDASRGRWFRFSFRGLPQEHFRVEGDQLFMKVEFSARDGASPLDGVTRALYPLVERDRRDLAVNGVGGRGGAAAWKDYRLDFRIPFPEVDRVDVVVGFRRGAAASPADALFLVDDLALVAIPGPDSGRPAGGSASAAAVARGATLVPLGGRWFYAQPPGEAGVPKVFDRTNSDRLLYRAGGYEAPFARNMSAVLKAGFLDRLGEVVEADREVPDNVTVAFEGGVMVVRAKNLPNHPVGRFPDLARAIDGNPNAIQEMAFTYHIPLEPRHEPRALAMDRANRNAALPTACGTAIAVNGVLFHNPFDAGMTEAVDIMDRCCGHPSPDNRYHYHKYPVCVKSPWDDAGEEHSPLIGWAFDGYPIYGPYERRGVMARDDDARPLDAFNGHEDDARGWHYHVTPGRFPYVIGGYRGEVDPRNFLNEPGVRDMGGGPGFLPGPLVAAINVDGDDRLTAGEIEAAPRRLAALDRNRDGALSVDEARPRPPGALKKLAGPRGGPGPRPLPPLFVALDADHDGTISAAELDASARVLSALDRDGDRSLSRAEVQLARFRRK